MPYLILLKGDPEERGNYKVLHVHRDLREQSFISKERQLLLLPGAKVFLKLPTERSFKPASQILHQLYQQVSADLCGLFLGYYINKV